jgi:hypothetical protein
MITHEVVNGKQATVSHMSDTWEPCDPKDAAMVKVVFDDGGVVFGFRKAEQSMRSGPTCYESRSGDREWF